MKVRNTLAVTDSLLDELVDAGRTARLVVRIVPQGGVTLLGRSLAPDGYMPDPGEIVLEIDSRGSGLTVSHRGAVVSFPTEVAVPGGPIPLHAVRVVGARIQLRVADDDLPAAAFDRQVRAFGPDGQRLLRHLRVGVVGVSGTGSPVAEMLVRLGVGTVICIDPDEVTDTNLTRIWNSGAGDVGEPKVALVPRSAEAVGFGTDVIVEKGSVTQLEVARLLRTCDVVFGCTDDNRGRQILSRLAYWYLIPTFDLGVKLSSLEGVLQSIDGRVTYVGPGAACLDCRNRIDRNVLRSELLPPEERAERAREGYAAELPDADPAVIAFTTGVASLGVAELLIRLFGVDDEEPSTERLVQFHFRRIAGNTASSVAGHYCVDGSKIGAGDTDPFLGTLWT